MGIRKYGTGDDQKIDVDRQDEQGVHKTARVETWTPEDTRALMDENPEAASE